MLKTLTTTALLALIMISFGIPAKAEPLSKKSSIQKLAKKAKKKSGKKKKKKHTT